MEYETQESKRKQIEKLLKEGNSPEEIAEIVDCTVRYAYQVKAQVEGEKKREPTVKNHVSEIKETLRDLCKDVRTLARSETGETDFAVCSVCGKPFRLQDQIVCDECSVIFCSAECIEKHGEDDFIDDSKCEQYQKITSQVKEGDENE